MTWPRAREADLERDMYECVYMCPRTPTSLCAGTAESRYQMELLLTTVTKPGLKITCSIRKDDTPAKYTAVPPPSLPPHSLSLSLSCADQRIVKFAIVCAAKLFLYTELYAWYIDSSDQSNLMYEIFLRYLLLSLQKF